MQKEQPQEIRPEAEARRVRKKLLAWYQKNRRDLPWRKKTADPYRIWISEIMLQQTQVHTVIPYYRRFLKRFPDIEALAVASLEEVLKLWENLGYYSRARNLHKAAKIISGEYGGIFPADIESIWALPGIGAYTAAAILSMAFGKPIAAVDGNVRRVLARLYGIGAPTSQPGTLREIKGLAEALVPPRATSLGAAGDFNQAVMDLGAAICIPGTPLCPECPLMADCVSFRQGRQAQIPVSVKKKPLVVKHATAAFIAKAKRILILQRPGEGLLAGLWKLPGGFQSDHEPLTETLERTVREETGLTISSAETAATVNHTFTHFRLQLHGFRCTASGKVRPSDGAGFQWITPSEISLYSFGKADRELLKTMVRLLSP